jgi:hypothetical protein
MKSRGMVIIAGRSCDPVLLHRFAQFFVNRGLKLYIYDPPQVPGSLLSKVTIVHNVNKFSVNVTAAFMLCARTFHEDEELRNWVLRSACSNPPNPFTANFQSSADAATKQTYLRLIALDFRLFDVKHMHTLYLGAADESAIGAGRPHPRFGDPLTSQCTFEAVVADIG